MRMTACFWHNSPRKRSHENDIRFRASIDTHFRVGYSFTVADASGRRFFVESGKALWYNFLLA